MIWPEAAGFSDAELEARLFPTEHVPSSVHRPPPNYEYIYQELRRYRKINLTLTQLWLEYKEQHPDGYQYTQFCEYYRRWLRKLDYCMRQEHRAGEKAFIDYCDGLAIVDALTARVGSHPAVRRRVGAPRTTPMPRRRFPKRCPTGSGPM